MPRIRFSSVVILWFAIYVSLIQCRENYNIALTRINCVFNYGYALNTTTICKRIAINRNIQTMTIAATNSKKISDISAYVTLNYKFLVYRPLLINRINVDCCDLMRNSAGKAPLFKLLGNIVIKHGNFLDNNRTCPLKEGTAIYLKDVSVNDADLPEFLPAGDFRLDIDMYTRQSGKYEQLLLMEMFLTIEPKGTKLLAMG